MSTALLETAIVDGSPPLASPADSAAETARGRWQPSTATVAAIGFALAGLVAGLRPIHDNSFLTHLATGRLLLHGTFPRHDPYSFTAHGTSWIVESWLPSLGYAAIEKVLG